MTREEKLLEDLQADGYRCPACDARAPLGGCYIGPEDIGECGCVGVDEQLRILSEYRNEATSYYRSTVRDIARVAGLAIGEAWQESDALRLVEVLATAFQQVTKERDRLTSKNAKLRKVANEVWAVIKDSNGVDGFHLNGDTALWDEFGGLMEALKEAGVMG